MKSLRISISSGLLSLSLLAATSAQAQLALIRQGAETRGEEESGDRFGAAVCAGDFNGDGYDDLAAGAPGEYLPLNFLFAGGYVTVNYGTPHGLTWTGAQGRGPANAGLSEGEPHEMGAALASADFNNDGFDDLAVGLPGSPVSGNFSAGRVVIFMGSASGLSSSAALVLTQTAFGGANESGDRFGAALAAGKLGTDQYADLVIGGPGENGTGSGVVGEGAVFIIRGGPGGLDTTLSKFITGDTAIPGAAAQNGGYGTSLAIGQLRDDASAELAVGAPYLVIAGAQGAVAIHAANTTSVANAAANLLTAANDPVTHGATAGFGYALAIGRFNPLTSVADPRRAIAIGTLNSGSVSLARINGTTAEFYDTLIGANTNNAADGIGRSLATGDLDGDGRDDLVIGQPLFDATTTTLNGFYSAGTGSGRVALRYFTGSVNGWSGNEYWDEADAGALYQNGAMGTSLAIGRFSNSPRRSVAIGCPGADHPASDHAGYVLDLAPWRQVRRPGCKAALSADCDDNVVYALRPFDRLKIASTTKIMTVLLGCEATARPANDPLRVRWDEFYTIEPWLTNQFDAGSSCSKWSFFPYTSYSFLDLMRTCIMVSGNDSAFAIADAMTNEAVFWNGYTGTVPAFTMLMNARAAQIGMANTLFTNPAGVDPGDPYSTAWDMWLLAHTAMQNELFRSIVGDTSALIAYESPTGSTLTRQCNYNWLSGLKSQDARIIGIKPGSTPLAGRTSVTTGEPSGQPGERAFGIGLGWFGEYQNESGRARVEILQLGLNACDPEPPSKFTGPLSDNLWGLQTAGEPSTSQGMIQPRGPGERSLAVEFHFARPTHLAATPPVEVKLIQDILFDIPSGGVTELELSGLPGHRGFSVRNTGDVAAPLIIEAPGTTRVTLAPNQTHTIPAASGPVFIRLTADGAPADISLSGVCDVTPRWANIPFAPAVTTRMELPAHVVQHAWQITACALANLPQPFPLRVIVDEPFNGLRFPRVPDLDGLTLTPTGPTERLVLDFRGIPGLEPANGYDILGGNTLDGTMTPLTRIAPAANGQALYHTTLSLPAANRRFLKIAPAP